MRTPLVSIGLPTYNRATYLRDSLRYLLGQDYQNIELTVTDNASTDNTQEILEECTGDARLRFNRQLSTVSAYDNFMDVFGKASGDYFMWAADDDAWESTFVSKLMNCFEQFPNLVLAMSHYDVHNRVIDSRHAV